MVRWPLAALTVLIASCGRPLGEYEVSNVSVVPWEEVKKVEPFFEADTQMLRVEFKSTTNLNEVSDGGDGLYVVTSFCPFDRDRMIYIGGPYQNGGARFGDGPVRATKDARGKYVYTTYLRLEMQARPEQPGKDEQIAYDLRSRPTDLCMRIEHPDMVITPSRSKSFVVPTELIRHAVLNAPPA